MKTPTDAAPERKELRMAEALGQSSIAGEDHAQERARIEVLARHNAELAEYRRWHFLRFVDDQHRPHQRRADVLGPARSQRLEARPPIMAWEWHSEDVADL